MGFAARARRSGSRCSSSRRSSRFLGATPRRCSRMPRGCCVNSSRRNRCWCVPCRAPRRCRRASDRCTSLEALAATELIVLDGRGLTVNGITRTHAAALERVVCGNSSASSAQATRAARYRLNRLLKRQHQTVIVNAAQIACTLERIAANCALEDLEAWNAAIAAYRTRHALGPTRLRSRPPRVPG
jgi:hypothetical protein